MRIRYWSSDVCSSDLVAVDLNAEGLQSLTAEHPDRIITASGSVADPAFAESTVARGVEKWGAIHGLVNNAGVVRAAMIAKMSNATWQEEIGRAHVCTPSLMRISYAVFCLKKKKTE